MKLRSGKDSITVLGRKEKDAFTPSLTMRQRAMRSLWHDRTTVSAMVCIVALALIALFAPTLSEAFQVNPTSQDLRNKYADLFAPGHPLGTDELGRDHLSRLLYGGQVSLGVAFSAAILSLGIGVAVGAYAGYFGGIVDDLVVWFITTLNAIPGLFLLIIITALLSPAPGTMVLIFGVLGWTGVTRLVRAETYSIKERDYVIAARALGASDVRIMFVHIVPNIFSLLVVSLTLGMGGLILAESALSFIGFGIRAPTPTWGNMLNGALEYMRRAPHLMVLPGLLISLTVFCLYLIGDGLRDAFDPKTAD